VRAPGAEEHPHAHRPALRLEDLERGAVGGVALGVAISIVYWAIAALLEAMGGVGQLPPLLSGWSPDIIFFFLGMYFIFRMPT
jgi:lipopolysaccharide export system permease protein